MKRLLIYVLLLAPAVYAQDTTQIAKDGEKYEGYQYWGTPNACIMEDSILVGWYRNDIAQGWNFYRWTRNGTNNTQNNVGLKAGEEFGGGSAVVFEDQLYMHHPGSGNKTAVWYIWGDSLYVDTTLVTTATSSYRGMPMGHDATVNTWVTMCKIGSSGFPLADSIGVYTVSGDLSSSSSWSYTDHYLAAANEPMQFHIAWAPIHKGYVLLNLRSPELIFVDSVGTVHEGVQEGPIDSLFDSFNHSTDEGGLRQAHYQMQFIPDEIEGQDDLFWACWTEETLLRPVIYKCSLDISGPTVVVLDADTIPDNGVVSHAGDSLGQRWAGLQIVGDGMVVWAKGGSYYDESADSAATIDYWLYTDRTDLSTRQSMVNVWTEGDGESIFLDLNTPWICMDHSHADSSIILTTMFSMAAASPIIMAIDTIETPSVGGAEPYSAGIIIGRLDD